MTSPAGTKTILVVDDFEGVCEVIEVLLSRAGYRVLTATSGTDALDLARDTPGIQLLMSNIDMPGMRGDELAARFAALYPSVPVVFLSSWNDRITAAEPFAFLAKPFTVTELRDTVRRALGMRPALAETSCAP